MKGRREGFPNQTLVRMPVDSIECMKSLPLCRALYVTDIGYFPQAQNHYVERPNGCDNFILIHCISGSGWCKLDGEHWNIGPERAVLIPAGVPHAYGTLENESWRIRWVHFNGIEAPSVFGLLHEGNQPVIYLPRPERIIDAFEDTLRWTTYSHTNNSLVAMSGACARLLGLIAETRRATASRIREVEERVNQTINLMRESLHQPLSLQNLANEACLSVPHYCVMFKRQTGNSPMQLYAQMRIQRACELLHNTDLRILDIAREVGYDDVFYFSRIFKKTMGLPPRQFRDSMG